MLDIGGDELLLTAFVAIIVIGPKDLPRAMRFAGRWVAKMRRMNRTFRTGLENFVKEGEIRELEADWAEKREAILTQYAALESSVKIASSDDPAPQNANVQDNIVTANTMI